MNKKVRTWTVEFEGSSCTCTTPEQAAEVIQLEILDNDSLISEDGDEVFEIKVRVEKKYTQKEIDEKPEFDEF